MCTKSQNNIVLDFQVFCISKVLNVEELLNFSHTVFCQVDTLIFFINDKVTCFFDFFTKNCIHLGELTACLTTLQLTCKNVTCFVKLCRLSTLSGNDKRSSCFINQYRVDFIDDGIFQSTLYELFFINNHVISQIVKSEFIVCYISNITVICCTTFVIIHTVQNNTYCKSKEFMYLSHPLSISFCEVIVDCYNMNTFTCKSIQICWKCRYKCLTFTSSHLCNSSLMKNHTTNNLNTIMFHSKRSACRFSYNCVGFWKNIVKCLSLCKSIFKFFCFIS